MEIKNLISLFNGVFPKLSIDILFGVIEKGLPPWPGSLTVLPGVGVEGPGEGQQSTPSGGKALDIHIPASLSPEHEPWG